MYQELSFTLVALLALLFTLRFANRKWIRILSLGPPVAVIYFAGPYRWAIDILALLPAFGLAEAFRWYLSERAVDVGWIHKSSERIKKTFRAKHRLREWLPDLSFLLLMPLGWWIVASLGNWAVRFDRGTPPAPRPLATNNAVQMTLSGGGYRAALFHAGVMRQLEDEGLTPSRMATVSGGSILGTFYAAGGTPAEFLQHMEARELSLLRYVLDAPTPIWLLGSRLSRTTAHAELLDDVLLGGLTWSMLEEASGPALILCTTDVASGMLVGWMANGYVLHGLPWWLGTMHQEAEYLQVARSAAPLPPDDDGSDQVDAVGDSWRLNPLTTRFVECLPVQLDQRPLSHFVAASGAFPGVFDLLEVPHYSHTEDGRDQALPGARFHLADGGVVDNSGLSLLLATSWTELREQSEAEGSTAIRRPRVIIESDASEILERIEELNPFQTITRWADVLYGQAQSASREVNRRTLVEEFGMEHVRVSPHRFHMPHPIATNEVLLDCYGHVMSQPAQAENSLRNRMTRAGRASSDPTVEDLRFFVQQMRINLVEVKVRNELMNASFETLKRMLIIANDEASGAPERILGSINLEYWERSRITFRMETSIALSELQHRNPRFLLLRPESGEDDREVSKDVQLWSAGNHSPFAEARVEALFEDLWTCLEEYSAASTLDDSLPASRSRAIFRLGRYLACLAGEEIQAAAK